MTAYLTPSSCARVLGMTGAFIRGEIKDGRLRARIFKRDSGRSVYRIEQNDFDAYLEQHWPHVSRATQANPRNTELRAIGPASNKRTLP